MTARPAPAKIFPRPGRPFAAIFRRATPAGILLSLAAR
jgi:hypothetical protein